MHARLRLALQRRPRQLVIAAITLLTATAMLVGALLVNPDDPRAYWQGLLLNIGSALLLALVTYGLVQAVVVAIHESSTTEHPRLNLDTYIHHVSRSTRQVTIVETCTELLEPWRSAMFLAAVEQALQRGAQFELFILDPDSDAARQRTLELQGKLNIPSVIYTNLRSVLTWTDERDGAKFLDRFRVFVCHQHPQIQVYRWDDRALISFHMEGELNAESPQIETHMTRTPWGDFVEKRRLSLAVDNRTCDLAAYRSRKLTLASAAEAATARTIDVLYVTILGVFYVRNADLADDPAAVDGAVVSLSAWPNDPPVDFTMSRPRGSERRQVNDVFFQKYGQQFEVYFRLAPVDPKAINSGAVAMDRTVALPGDRQPLS